MISRLKRFLGTRILTRLRRLILRDVDSDLDKVRRLAQVMVSLDPKHCGVELGRTFLERYPDVFEQAACAICDGMDFRLAHAGHKPLGGSVYPGAPALPYYARGVFPLVYMECQKCGVARINPTPKESWVDFKSKDPVSAGQAEWMEDPDYVADKQYSISTHHQQMALERFRSDRNALLDVGCGSGVGLETLRQKFDWGECVGVEIDPKAVQFARTKRRLQVHCGLVYDAALPDRAFDLAIMDNALEHHWNTRGVLRKLRRALRDGGGVFIVVPNYHGYAVEYFGVKYCNMNWGHWHYFTVQGLRTALQDTGFELERAYSSVCEQMVMDKLNGKLPDGVHTDLQGSELRELRSGDRAFRGDFIHLLATAV